MDNWISTETQLLPDFIIGGAMKCGTTTLHAILSKHPKVFIPEREINFFDIDNILQHSDFNFHHNEKWITQTMEKDPQIVWEWYQEKFKGNEKLVKGEDSTTYLASKISAKRISKQHKKIKMIFLLRQPTLRAYSNYNHLLRTGRATYSFEDTIRFNPFQVINRSLYKEQLESFYQYIPKERIKIILFEDFITKPHLTIKEISDFIEIDYNEFPANIFKNHFNKGKAPKSNLLQTKKNILLRDFGNTHYNNRLPFPPSTAQETTPFIASIINKLHNMINPQTSFIPAIKAETKFFLDNYFYKEMEGIEELIDKDILYKWFPKDKNNHQY